MDIRTGRDGTFSRNRAVMSRASRWTAYVLAIGGLILALIWFLFVSRFWSVTKLDIQGLTQIDRGEVERDVFDLLDNGPWRPWDRRNIFFIHPNTLQQALRDRILAESVIVDKSYPDVLRLIIVERQRSVILLTDNRSVQVDLNGIVSGNLPASSTAWVHDVLAGKSFADAHHQPIILIGSVETSSSSDMATSSGHIADPEAVRGWINVYHTLISSGWHFKTFQLDQTSSRTLKIAVQGGFDVIIDLDTPLEPQIETFNRFLELKPKDAIIHEYINVTVPGRVSFK